MTHLTRTLPLTLSLTLTLTLSLTLSRPASADPTKETITLCADAAEHGQELRASQKLVSARQNFVTCAHRDCPTAVRDSCTEWLADLDRRLPSIVIGAKDDRGADVRDVIVTLDGVRLPDVVTSAAVNADPGPHTLSCEAPGYASANVSLVLREGEALRVVAVTMNKLDRPDRDKAEIGPPPQPQPSSRPFPVLPLVLAGASVVALGVFGVAAATGASDYHSLENDCSPRCPSDRIDSVRTRFVVADIALVAGIVLGGTALGLWLFDRPKLRE